MWTEQEAKGLDWETLRDVERDICFLYHELAEYPGINGDLYYGGTYALPYWEFLNIRQSDVRDEQRRFIRDGCLMMLLAMAYDVIDGSGSYIKEKYILWRSALAQAEVENERTEKLLRTVTLALDFAEQGLEENEILRELSLWANYEYGQGYFRSMLREPYKAREA